MRTDGRALYCAVKAMGVVGSPAASGIEPEAAFRAPRLRTHRATSLILCAVSISKLGMPMLAAEGPGMSGW